jgi:hypothetical protein
VNLEEVNLDSDDVPKVQMSAELITLREDYFEQIDNSCLEGSGSDSDDDDKDSAFTNIEEEEISQPLKPSTPEPVERALDPIACPHKGELYSSRREQLVSFYLEHNPEKIADVDNILGNYKFDDVVRSLEHTYMVRPLAVGIEHCLL